MEMNKLLAYLAMAGVLVLTLISLVNFELFVEWVVKGIVAALLIGLFVKASMGKL